MKPEKMGMPYMVWFVEGDSRLEKEKTFVILG